jgi:hypothetical protein
MAKASPAPRSEIIETIAWNARRRLADGRSFVTDGKLLIDVSYWAPFFPDDTIPGRACGPPVEAFERLLRMKAGGITVALDDLVFDRQRDCFVVPGHDTILLGKQYVYFLMALRPSSRFRLRCAEALTPAFIHDGRKRIGVLMPLRETQAEPNRC